MKKRVVIFFLVLVLYISLSNAIKTITVNETELVSLRPQARDEDEDRLFYSFTEPLDKEGKWQTNYGDAGEYKIIITASDGELSTSKDVLLVVKKRNIEPTIDWFVPKEREITIDEGEGMDFDAKASDANKDELLYRWEFDGKTVSEESGYSYKADYLDEGAHKIRLIVSDGEKEKDVEWTINVNNVDREALLDDIGDITAEEGNIARLKLPDFGKYNLEYSIAEPIGNDNYWETGYDDAGEYNIEVGMKDRSFSYSRIINLKVINVDRGPVFKPIANAWMKENQKVSIELEAYDPDGDKIEFSAESLPKGAYLDGNRFEWATDYDTVEKGRGLNVLDKFHLLYKPFKVIFIAKGNELEKRQSVLIMIKDANRAPVLEDIPTITVNEGEEAVINARASDPDGDNVTYSYSGWISLDRYTTGYDDAGTYKVKVVASDGFLTDEKYATIVVNDVNRVPVFNEIPKIEINENERLELRLYASDADGDSVDISSELLPRNSTIEDGIFTWTPDYDTVNADSGVIVVNFKASDSKDEGIKQANITVHNVNRAPRIKAASQRDITVKKGTKVKFEVVAEDADGDELSYLWRFSLFEEHKAGNAIIRKFTTTGDKKVRVIISDGKEEAEYVFNVKVVEG